MTQDTDNTEPLLQIRDLHASVGDTEILNGVNLTVNVGEAHAIMGPNGSGKSTLANVLAGRPEYIVTQGEVLYKGQDLLRMNPETRAREGIFLAFQYPVELAGVRSWQFLKASLDALRQHKGQKELSIREFDRHPRGADGAYGDVGGPGKALRQRGLFGRGEEAQRDTADGPARPQAGAARRDRLGPRHRRVAHRRQRREPPARAGQGHRAGDSLPAHTQLHHPRLRARARLGPGWQCPAGGS